MSNRVAELEAELAKERRKMELNAQSELEGETGGIGDIPDDIPDNDPRTPRALETREAQEAPKSWSPSNVLPEPNKRPGYEHRWIRVSSRGELDNRNVSAKFREHWVPVNKAEYPEIMVMQDRDAEFPDSIQIGGLVLCRNSTEVIDQRNAHFKAKAQGQVGGGDAAFKAEEMHPMPIHTDLGRRTQVEFGSGNPPE